MNRAMEKLINEELTRLRKVNGELVRLVQDSLKVGSTVWLREYQDHAWEVLRKLDELSKEAI